MTFSVANQMAGDVAEFWRGSEGAAATKLPLFTFFYFEKTALPHKSLKGT
jgi:hypothetical protein